MYGFGRPYGLVQGLGEGAAETLAGHLQDVEGARLTRGRFQEQAGAAVYVQDVTPAGDENRGRGDVPQQGLLGDLAQRRLLGDRRLGGAGREHRTGRGRRELVTGAGPRSADVLPARVQLGLAVHPREQVVELADPFGRAQEQEPTGVERVMKQEDQLLLQLRPQVDHEVAATDEVEFGEGRVLDHVLLGKDNHVADALADAVPGAVRFGGKKPRQSLGREVGGDAGRVETGAGGGDRAAVDVGGEHLRRVTLLEGLDPLLEEHREGIGLLAGGAPGRPHPD